MSPISTSGDLGLGRRAMALLDALAQHSDEPTRLTRLYLSKAHRRAADATLRLMQEAGLDSHMDPLGSVVGRLPGSNPDAPAILIGSHIDTVVDAGRYDGTLGVVLGIVVVEALRERGIVPSCPIEIVAFGDEENARFPTNLSTSAAFSGRYDPAWLDGTDQHGVTLRDALTSFGGDAAAIAIDRSGAFALSRLSRGSYRTGAAARRRRPVRRNRLRHQWHFPRPRRR